MSAEEKPVTTTEVELIKSARAAANALRFQTRTTNLLNHCADAIERLSAELESAYSHDETVCGDEFQIKDAELGKLKAEVARLSAQPLSQDTTEALKWWETEMRLAPERHSETEKHIIASTIAAIRSQPLLRAGQEERERAAFMAGMCTHREIDDGRFTRTWAFDEETSLWDSEELTEAWTAYRKATPPTPAPMSAEGWQPMSEEAKNGDVILRPHVIWGAMDVRYEETVVAGELPWLNGDLTTAWPEEAFLPFWMPRPLNPAPGKETTR